MGIDKCGFHQSRFIPGAACKQNIHAFEFLMATVIAKSGRRARPFFVKTKHGIRCYPNLVYMGTTVQNALNFVLQHARAWPALALGGGNFSQTSPSVPRPCEIKFDSRGKLLSLGLKSFNTLISPQVVSLSQRCYLKQASLCSSVVLSSSNT